MFTDEYLTKQAEKYVSALQERKDEYNDWDGVFSYEEIVEAFKEGFRAALRQVQSE